MINSVMGEQQMDSGHPAGFPVYRNRRGWPCWYQRFVEAGLIIVGSWSLHRAYQKGLDDGSAKEYQRTVVMGGR